MKWLFGWPIRGCWIIPKPSSVTSRGLAGSKRKDCRLVPAAKVEVSPELTLEVGLEIMPEAIVEKIPEGEEANCSTESSVSDVEMWVEWQAQHLGTPAWWVELGAIPGTKDL